MCAALPALGAVTPLFFGSLAIQGAQMVAQNRLASRTATAQYAAARRSADSAAESFTQQQEGAGANLKETRASQAQKRLAASIQGRQAQGKVAAAEGVAGNLSSLLSRDAVLPSANLKNSIDQSVASAEGQFRRQALGLTAQRDSRLNAATDMQNQAYNTAKANSSGIFDFLGAGVNTYTGLLGQA